MSHSKKRGRRMTFVLKMNTKENDTMEELNSSFCGCNRLSDLQESSSHRENKLLYYTKRKIQWSTSTRSSLKNISMLTVTAKEKNSIVEAGRKNEETRKLQIQLSASARSSIGRLLSEVKWFCSEQNKEKNDTFKPLALHVQHTTRCSTMLHSTLEHSIEYVICDYKQLNVRVQLLVTNKSKTSSSFSSDASSSSCSSSSSGSNSSSSSNLTSTKENAANNSYNE
uniref:Uncharacterized protein LOC114329948 n=1 Tax=Diabrotica virgifera virgifera TaxID=50390 RepID=A0A6P7FQ02_DIAVI